MSEIVSGDLRLVTRGDFLGKILRVGQGYERIVPLQAQDKEGRWVDFCSIAPTDVLTMTKSVMCPVGYGHHLGECCVTCGNDERNIAPWLPDNPDLTASDRAYIKRRDEIYEANWPITTENT